jgi:hypothetical protein
MLLLAKTKDPSQSLSQLDLAEGESVIRSDLSYRYHWSGVRLGDLHVTSLRLVWIPRAWQLPSKRWEAARYSVTGVVCQARPVKWWAYTVQVWTLDGVVRFAILGPNQIALTDQWRREIIEWLER